MLASIPKVVYLFFKSAGQFLIDMPVQVGASVDKHGHIRKPHVRIQKVLAGGDTPKQDALFSEDEAPTPKPAKKASKLDTFINKHGGLASLAHVMAGLAEGQQQRIFAEMGKLSGQTAVEVSAMFDNIKPVAPPQADMFAQPKPDKPVAPQDSKQNQPVAQAEQAPPAIEQVAEQSPQNSDANPGAFGVQAGISKQARRDLNAQAVAIINRGGAVSEADKAILRQYSGNGGCGDSLNEFYTLPEVADAMWQVAQRLGAQGSVLEPSCGPGVFLHTAPANCRVSGVEMDPVSAKIARVLHGERHEVANASLERFATSDERQFDAVLGNVPFGLRGSLIKDDKPGLKTADAYFFDTSMDKCKAGGIVGLIVPTGVMDSRTNRKLRETLLRKGQFLGAQRMPNTAFEHSHTEVTTDVVWFRKFPDDVAGALSSKDVTQEHLKTLGVWDDEFLSGGYFTGRGAANVLGTMGEGWRAKAGMGVDITVEGSMRDVPQALAEFTPEAAKPMPSVTGILAAVGGDSKTRERVLGATMGRPYQIKAKAGDTKVVDGVTYVLQGRPPRWHSVDEVVASKALTSGQELAGRIDALLGGMVAVDRPKLEADLRAWVAEHGNPAKNRDILLGAHGDKTLYRLIGAVNAQGEFSDAIAGRAVNRATGNFEATVQSLLNDHETAGVRQIAKSAGIGEDDASDQLYGSSKYAIDPATGEWTTKDIYLTGDLWVRLDAAKAALAGDLTLDVRTKVEQQAAMLNEAIAPVSLEEAFIQVNSAFLPTTMLSEFLTWRNTDGPDANEWTKKQEPVEVTFGDGVYTITGGNTWGLQKDLDKFLNRTGLRKEDKHVIDDLNVEFKDWLCASAKYREQAEDLYNRSFRGFREREFSNEPMDIPGMNADGLKEYQWGTLRWALNAGKGIIASDVGLGKAQPLNAKLLTPSGWKLMGDIQVGDSVIAGDGSATKVTGVFPQGEKEIFRVTMSDGAATECCDEHLWLTQTTKERNNQRRGLVESGAPKVRQLLEIRATLQNLGREKNHAIPMVQPVEFVPREVKIDPYLLGVLIGDGCLGTTPPNITNPESEIIEAIRKKLPDGFTLNEPVCGDGRCQSYSLCRTTTSHGRSNQVALAIAEYGLNKLSNGKFIPDDYKFNTPDVRLAMLQGLMDTDGYVDQKGVTVQFTTVAEQLALDVQFVVNSLGGNATIKSKIPTFTYKGEKKVGQRAYTVHLRLPPLVTPFLHSVKRHRVLPKSKYLPIRYIVGVESVGVKQAQCISVEHASRLYVTDDFIVTHNTVVSLMLAKTMVATGQAKRPMIVVPKSVLSNWAAEAEKWFPGSRVLLIGEAKDTPAERKRKYHDMQQNQYDFIIISEPSFEELDLDPVTKGEYNSKDFWVQRGDKLGNAGDKRTNQIKTAWDQARAGQTFDDKDRTDATYFNDMGVDALIYDEAHHLKNLASLKSRFGESPKFMGGGGQSMRSLDFNLKSRWLLDQNGGKNVYLATATPSKNSIIEVFSMIAHVAPEVFEKIGIRNSEEFLDRFARFENGMAMNTAGKMEEALITAGFQNMDELRTIMKRVIRRKTAADVGLKLPERQDVQHMIDMDDQQQAAYAELRELAAQSGGKDATGDAHIFSIMDKMNKAATDMSLLDPAYDATKAPKYVACAKEILAGMKDGGQIVFSDYVDSHEKIAAALVASGVPRNQIGIINAKATASSASRQKICDAFNAGKLKVVIGNTAVMGEGLNLQKGTSDIHHLDLPWEPASMQQRNGRGLRQGNTNKGVRIHSYLTRGSFDGYRLQTIMAKKDWQDAIWNGDNEVENLNKKGVDRDELMIMLAADPDQAREAIESNHAAKEARLVAGKTADASQRFVKFQELKRSFNALKNKDTQTAARLKAKMDKEASNLRADRYFKAKQALDMDDVIVADAGILLHAGAGVEVSDGDKVARWVVTGVDPRKGDVFMRKYGDHTGKETRVMPQADLPSPKLFDYNETTETAEINRKLQDEPIKLKSFDDLNAMPSAVLESNHQKIQDYLWQATHDYNIYTPDKVPMIHKASGKLVMKSGYEVRGQRDTLDFMLPTDANKAKVAQAWMEARRGATFSTDTTQPRRGGKTITTAQRHYGSSLETSNPWNKLVKLHGGDAGLYGSDSPAIRVVKQQFVAEQMQRIKRAKSFADALNEALPTGAIVEPAGGSRAHVKMPKRVLTMLWARARHDGELDQPLGSRLLPQKEYGGGKFYDKHNGYATANSVGKTVHAALVKMASLGGYDDLVHAMVESGLRHKPDINHHEVMQAVTSGELKEGHLRAFQKLAEVSGVADKTRLQAGSVYGQIGASSQWEANANMPVRDWVKIMLEQRQKATQQREAQS